MKKTLATIALFAGLAISAAACSSNQPADKPTAAVTTQAAPAPAQTTQSAPSTYETYDGTCTYSEDGIQFDMGVKLALVSDSQMQDLCEGTLGVWRPGVSPQGVNFVGSCAFLDGTWTDILTDEHLSYVQRTQLRISCENAGNGTWLDNS